MTLETLFFRICLVVLGLVGFFLALYIYRKKRSQKSLVCPIGSSCTEIVYSEHSRFLGIPVEFLGMLYYAVIALSYAVFILFPGLSSSFLILSLLVVTTIAVLFSLYLTAIQAFVFKRWCTWCLFSAFLSTGIFVISLYLFF